MKLLQLLENMLRENVTGVDYSMFALYAHIFSELHDAFMESESHMDDVYQFLSRKYRKESSKKALNYFYNFLKQNKEHFTKKKESIDESEYKRKLLHNYWDKKGIDSKPIYHFLGLNPRNKEDRKEIFYHKLSYFGSFENIKKLFLEQALTGKPVHIESGGYSIDYLVTGIDIEMFEPDSMMDMHHDGEIFYEMTGLINGDTSEVTLMTNGETYNIGDLSKGNTDLDDSVVEEIGYELSDAIREYFDNISVRYGIDGDLVDYEIVNNNSFKSAQK